jgi:hypothetical protein
VLAGFDSLVSSATMAISKEAPWPTSPEVESLTIDLLAKFVVSSSTSARFQGAKLVFRFFKIITVSALASIL